MARRFQAGQDITFPVPAAMQVDGGPLTLLVVAKVNTSAYQPIVYSRASGGHGWWLEYDTTGGLHVNYGTGTTARNVGTAATGAWRIDVGSKDNGGTFHPFGRHFTGTSFATDSGDVDSGLTLIDGPAVDASWGITFARWGNTGTDRADDLEIAFFAAWNSLVSGATLAGLTKTKAGILAGSPTYWASFEGSTMTDSAGGTATVTGSPTVTTDPTGFFAASGLTQALPVASETNSAITLGRRKARALPVAVETSSAVTLAKSKRGTLPVASETSAAVTLGKSKRGTVPPATETSAAVTLGRTKRATLPVASETCSAVTLGKFKRGTLGLATETSTAGTLARSKRGALGVAVETSTALDFGTPEAGLIQALPVAVETSSAVTLGRRKRGALPVVVETNTAVELGQGGLVQALPIALELNSALGFAGHKRGELPPAYEYNTAVTLGGGAPEGSGVMILGDIMDEIAARLRQAPTLAGRTTAYPPASVKAPAAVVTFPSEYLFDLTYGRGMDRMKGEVVVVVGRPTERQTRDRITRYVDGAGPESVKALVDGDDYASCDSVRVESALFDVVTIGGVEYLAAVFSVDIVGRGALS